MSDPLYRIQPNPSGVPDVIFPCPGCAGDLMSPLDDAGKADECPVCGTKVTVPGEAELAEHRRQAASSLDPSRPAPTPETAVEAMARKFIAEVRDATLRQQSNHLFGTWAVAQNNAIFHGLVAHLDEAQKDMLWKLVVEAVDQTIGLTLMFLDHKRVTGGMRVALIDPGSKAEEVFPAPADDVQTLFWFEWLEKHARMTGRPTKSPRGRS